MSSKWARTATAVRANLFERLPMKRAYLHDSNSPQQGFVTDTAAASTLKTARTPCARIPEQARFGKQVRKRQESQIGKSLPQCGRLQNADPLPGNISDSIH